MHMGGVNSVALHQSVGPVTHGDGLHRVRQAGGTSPCPMSLPGVAHCGDHNSACVSEPECCPAGRTHQLCVLGDLGRAAEDGGAAGQNGSMRSG